LVLIEVKIKSWKIFPKSQLEKIYLYFQRKFLTQSFTVLSLQPFHYKLHRLLWNLVNQNRKSVECFLCLLNGLERNGK
jgi:hypothetical protein